MSTLHALLGPASPTAPAPKPWEWIAAGAMALGLAVGIVFALWGLVSLAVLAYTY